MDLRNLFQSAPESYPSRPTSPGDDFDFDRFNSERFDSSTKEDDEDNTELSWVIPRR